MNQITILKKEEETPKHTLAVELDDEHKIVLDIDINYLLLIGLEHIKYKVSKSKIKAPIRRLKKIEDKVIDIILEKEQNVVLNLMSLLRNGDSQAVAQVFNQTELETNILSFILEKATDEVFEILKKDELN